MPKVSIVPCDFFLRPFRLDWIQTLIVLYTLYIIHSVQKVSDSLYIVYGFLVHYRWFVLPGSMQRACRAFATQMPSISYQNGHLIGISSRPHRDLTAGWQAGHRPQARNRWQATTSIKPAANMHQLKRELNKMYVHWRKNRKIFAYMKFFLYLCPDFANCILQTHK